MPDDMAPEWKLFCILLRGSFASFGSGPGTNAAPLLGSLQDRGFAVALVTDGRMSGASGKVPAAIHVDPEAAVGGPIARVRDGDVVTVDADAGALTLDVAGFEMRRPAQQSSAEAKGMGRELFAGFRQLAGSAEAGALSLPGVASSVVSSEKVGTA